MNRSSLAENALISISECHTYLHIVTNCAKRRSHCVIALVSKSSNQLNLVS